jgi:hypothetical protein
MLVSTSKMPPTESSGGRGFGGSMANIKVIASDKPAILVGFSTFKVTNRQSV